MHSPAIRWFLNVWIARSAALRLWLPTGVVLCVDLEVGQMVADESGALIVQHMEGWWEASLGQLIVDFRECFDMLLCCAIGHWFCVD